MRENFIPCIYITNEGGISLKEKWTFNQNKEKTAKRKIKSLKEMRKHLRALEI